MDQSDRTAPAPPDPPAPQYSPDGAWWWDGGRWMRAHERGTTAPASTAPSRPRRTPPAWTRRRSVRLAAGTVAAMLIAAVTAGVVVRLRQPQPGTSAALTRALGAQGMTCGRLHQVVAAAVWGCVADTYPSYHMVMAQYDGAGRLAYLDAVVDRQSLDARRYDTKAEARRLFTAAVRASFDEDRADRVLSWATARIGAERTTATIGDLHVTTESDRAPDDAILKVGRGRAMPADTLVPLPNASTTTGKPYFEKRGYTCRGGDLGTIECELGRPGFKGSAVMWPIARTSAVSDLSFGITAGDDYPRGDVRQRIRREFPPVLGMVFRGDDARRASSWTLAHLGKEQHMALVGGVLIELGPVAPGDWAPGRIYGMGFKLSTMTWV